MRFFQIADLHLGKVVNGFSMIEDQRFILRKIIVEVERYRPDVILIAGDVYDKSVPSIEAVHLLDEFLTELAARDLTVIMISGNHDSADRLAFAAGIIKSQNIYISPVFENDLRPIVLRDAYGEINVYMLPFIKPLNVRKHYPDIEIKSYHDALKTVVDHIEVDQSVRNIILVHQFIVDAKSETLTSDSEEDYVGAIGNVGAEIFADFDYVALGHLHRAQYIGRKTVRYAGSPLKYSFSEVNGEKSITCFDIAEKTAEIAVQTIPLKPLRDMVEIRGKYIELTARDYYKDLNLDDYYHVTLTDEVDVPNALGKLRSIYKNIMKLSYDNARTSQNAVIEEVAEIEQRRPIDIVGDFYKLQNNAALSDRQQQLLNAAIDKIWGSHYETN